MRRYALVVVGIVAVVLTGTISGGGGCVLSTAPDHSCCAEPVSEPTSSCCSSAASEQPRSETDRPSGCDCIHPPSTPANVVPSTAPPIPDNHASMDPMAEDVGLHLGLLHQARSIELGLRSGPLLPVYLLDCSFLI